MNQIDQVKKELNKIDGIARFEDLIIPKINPVKSTLFIIGKIATSNFTCTAVEYKVFADTDLSIIL